MLAAAVMITDHYMSRKTEKECSEKEGKEVWCDRSQGKSFGRACKIRCHGKIK